MCLGSSGLHTALVGELANQKDLALPPGDRGCLYCICPSTWRNKQNRRGKLGHTVWPG